MLQLVDERVHMFNPVKEDDWYDPATTEEFMGVKPAQVADLLALKGDAIDNIPGAPGIGDKGARDLIAALRFGGRRRSSTPPKWSARCIARACRTIASRFC